LFTLVSLVVTLFKLGLYFFDIFKDLVAIQVL
jgi:hypothetical protein